jgi:hydroxymethylpyrimidine pyrophosphatase-like HAD family hydrolase
MPNDIAMLQWAGTSYAMANAHPAAVAVAGESAPSHEDDGVAAVLTELFGLGPMPNP